MQEESAPAEFVDWGLQSEEEQISGLKLVERRLAPGPPEIDFVNVGLVREEFKPVQVGWVDVEFQTTLGRLRGIEPCKSFFQILRPRSEDRIRWYDDQRSVHFLQTMLQHRSIYFFEYVLPNVDPAIGVNPQDIAIKRRVMNPAKGEPVGDFGETELVLVWHNVGGVEELLVPKTADAATAVISSYYELAKSSLVEARFHRSHCVRPLDFELKRRRFGHRPERF